MVMPALVHGSGNVRKIFLKLNCLNHKDVKYFSSKMLDEHFEYFVSPTMLSQFLAFNVHCHLVYTCLLCVLN